jgi:hypothetical protein
MFSTAYCQLRLLFHRHNATTYFVLLAGAFQIQTAVILLLQTSALEVKMWSWQQRYIFRQSWVLQRHTQEWAGI